MPKIRYQIIEFRQTTLDTIEQADEIIIEYQRKGFGLTVRQLFYQFVSRNFIPNTQTEYNKLAKTISNARLVGLIDWDALVDRTRYVRSLSHWKGPAELIRHAATQYRTDRWRDQEYASEMWIEKDALTGVIE